MQDGGRRNYGRIIRRALLAVWLVTAIWQVSKPMPEGADVASPSIVVPESQVRFLHDVTYQDARGQTVSRQQIFDETFAIVDAAENFLVLDFFLFNSSMGDTGSAFRPLSRELADRLLARKRARPGLRVLLITDPINDVYGGAPSPLLQELEDGGIEVVRTSLNALRDSNPAYSALWRLLVQWFGNSPGAAWLPNPFDGGVSEVSLRSWLALANFKANHRKVVVADNAGGEWVALVTSANPHDASSRHSNVALRISGELATTVLDSELNVARFSDWLHYFDPGRLHAAQATGTMIEASFITEEAIRRRLLRAVGTTASGDEVRIATFYLSDRRVIDALVAASDRGANIRLILDPNKDAFGIRKDGVPNRPVAMELVERSNEKIQVRWYRTHGEQFHTKMALVMQGGRLTASLGSANFTRRNIGNYNLEANIELLMPADSALAREMTGYFDRLWSNDESQHIEYTAPFGAYRDDSKLRYWRYRFMEATGFSTF